MSATSSEPTGGSGESPAKALGSVVSGLRHWRMLVQLTPHDVSTEAGRTAERHRRVFWSAFGAVAARAAGLVTMLIAVPLTVHYLGEERYGLWMTISSLAAVTAFADLGLGSGLMTSLSHAHGRGDRESVRRYVSTAFFSQLGLAATLGVMLAVLWPFIPWPRIYNVAAPSAVADAGPATAVFLACSLGMLPLSVGEDTRTGGQSGFSHSLWLGIGYLAGLAGILVAIHLHAGLPWLVLTMSGGPLLGAFLSVFSLFAWEQPDLRPSVSRLGAPELRSLLRMAGLFLALEVAGFLMHSSDNFVLTQLRGAEAVTRYSVIARLFMIIPSLLAFVTTPLWPAYGEALARGDLPWVRRTLQRSAVITGAMAALGAAVLITCGRWIVDVWVGPEVEPSIALLAGLAVWTTLQCVGHALGMFLNGAGVVRFQVIFGLLAGVMCLAGKLVVTRQVGISGVVWGSAFAYVPCSLIPALLFIPRFLAERERPR